MAAAGVDERWCLGDLVGGEPVTAELLGAARQLDLLIAGNHDAWALGPDRVVARGRDVFRLSSRERPAVTASTAGTARRAIPCSGSSPRRLPERSCPTARRARSGSSAIRMNRRSSPTTAPRRARCGPFRASPTTGSRPAPAWPTRGRSAATRATRRAGGSSSTLTPVCCGGTARSSSPGKLPPPAFEPRRSHRRVTLRKALLTDGLRGPQLLTVPPSRMISVPVRLLGAAANATTDATSSGVVIRPVAAPSVPSSCLAKASGSIP